MADAGFFKGTSAEQDSRFANKQKKLLKQMKFPDNIDVKIDMGKVNLDVMKPWITKRLQELLGIEDDVVIEFVFNQLDDKHPDPKMMQINLTGFLGGSKARLFIGELWKFLASAQRSPDGMPAELVEMKKQELLKRQQEEERLREIRRREEDSYRSNIKIETQRVETKTRVDHNNHGNNKSNRRKQDSPVETTKRKPKTKRRSRSSSVSSRSRSPSPVATAPPPPPPPPPPPAPVPTTTHSKSSSKKKSKDKRKSVSASPPRTKSSTHKKKKSSRRTRSSSSSSSSSSSTSSPSKSRSSRSASPIGRPKSKKDRKQKKNQVIPPVKPRVKSRSRSPIVHRSKKSDEYKNKKYSHKDGSSRHHHQYYHQHRHPHNRRSRSHSRTSPQKSYPIKKSIQYEPSPPSPPKKPRLESQIRVQTPPPRPLTAASPSRSPSPPPSSSPPPAPIHPPAVDPPATTNKPSNTGRIVMMDETRADDMKITNSTYQSTTDSSRNQQDSEDETEIDLRERLLREKAIKSMQKRRLSHQNDLKMKNISERIVHQT